MKDLSGEVCGEEDGDWRESQGLMAVTLWTRRKRVADDVRDWSLEWRGLGAGL